jgi:hypothetical protein
MQDPCLEKLDHGNNHLVADIEAAFKATGVVLIRQEENQACHLSLRILWPTVTCPDDTFGLLLAWRNFFSYAAST